MADDEEGTTDTIRVAPTSDAGRADTARPVGTPVPLPPPPSVGGGQLATSPPTRPMRKRHDSLATPRPGDAARYTVGDMIGQGGMGEVLLAYDEQIGREVAIKRIRADQPSAEERARFVREARVQGRLEHPAVVPVYDLAVDGDGKPYFVMKRLSGTDMHELLKRMRSGEEGNEGARRRQLLRAFADVCLAVEFAHQRGVIHRDLKPANIMLGDFGEVYVLDWGVARASAALDVSWQEGAPASVRRAPVTPRTGDLSIEAGETQAGTVLGTPAYMAPEQLVGERAETSSDIYALGCILFEIAAGEALHPRTRSLGSALEDVDARPSVRKPDSPPELDAICQRAVRVEAKARYASARALGAAVQAFLDGDRDLEVRRELAQVHIAEAREALRRGEAETDRRAAMRAAGRALALDPTATEAADLVTALVLRPPPSVPDEVERSLASIDTDTARSHGRLAAGSMLGYLAFVPLLLWTGVRDVGIVALFAAVAVANAALLLVLSRSPRITRRGVYLSAVVNAVVIGIVCRMVGPFIIAPTLVISTLMAYASHPQLGRVPLLAAILGMSVALPWGLELAGVIPATYEFTHGAIVLSSPVVTFASVPTQIAFAMLLVALVVIVALLSRSVAIRQRDATRRLEVQAWHLRQILPTTAS
ncbi:MAG: protein kinase [Deltaproteobacteria bacterium]|nr:protein kinase [Deltaproteobacteria bacterium]